MNRFQVLWELAEFARESGWREYARSLMALALAELEPDPCMELVTSETQEAIASKC